MFAELLRVLGLRREKSRRRQNARASYTLCLERLEDRIEEKKGTFYFSQK